MNLPGSGAVLAYLPQFSTLSHRPSGSRGRARSSHASVHIYRSLPPYTPKRLSRSPEVPQTSCIQVKRPNMFSGDEMFMLTKWTRNCAHAGVNRTPTNTVAGRPGG